MSSFHALSGPNKSASTPHRVWSGAEVSAFMNELRHQLNTLEVFRGDKRGYILRSLWVVVASAIAWLGFLNAETWSQRLFLGLLSGYAGVQAAAIAHEAGHGAVTTVRSWANSVGHLFMTLLIGVSFDAWAHRHRSHHAYPNSRLDPDVRAGLFSFSEADAHRACGLAGLCTRYQHILLIPLSSLMGFTLKFKSWVHVFRNPAFYIGNLTLLVIHGGLWIVLPAYWIGAEAAIVNYLLLTWVEGAYLAFVFLPNHLGGPTAEEASQWPPLLRQIVSTRNLPASRFLTHLCIGLNTHIEHHLFGHLPATRLNEARETTRQLCLSYNIPYSECTIFQAFKEMQQYNLRMAMIARQAAFARSTAK